MVRKIFLFMFLIVVYSLTAINFEHIGTEKDFGTSVINNIYQDEMGYIWISSEEGLFRYDGKNIKSWKFNPLDSLSIQSNVVNTVIEDKNHNIWIGTISGLGVLNRDTNKIKRYFYNSKPFPLDDRFISFFYAGDDGNVYISTYQDGLIIYDKNTKNFTKFAFDKTISLYKAENNFDGNFIISSSKGFYKFSPKLRKIIDFERESVYNKFKNILILSFLNEKDYLWVATKDSFYKVDKKNNSMEKINLGDKKHFPKIFSIVRYKNKLLFASNYGFYIFNPKNNKSEIYKHDENDEKSLSNNFISKIFIDSNKNIWIGTDSGVDKINFEKEKIHTIANLEDKKKKADVVTIYNDSKNNLWVSKYGSGIAVWDKNKYKKPHFKIYSIDNSKLSGNYVYCFDEDNFGKLWIGTENGLSYFDYNKNKIFRITTTDSLFKKETIFSVKFSNLDNNLWIGTQSMGLISYNIFSGKISNYIKNDTLQSSINYKTIIDINIDSKERMWLCATNKGFLSFDRSTHKFKNFNKLNPEYSSDNLLMSKESPDGDIWVATFSRGILIFDPEKQVFKSSVKADDYTNNDIYGIVFDNNENVWISLKNAIFAYNKNKGIFNYFNYHDGLVKQINAYACDKDKGGNIYFGGLTGLSYFNPDSLKFNNYHPKVSISDVEVDSKYIPVNPYNNSKIVLNPHQKRIKIYFSVLDFTIPSKNTAFYKLEGYDKDWIKAEDSFSVQYSNLPDGNYVFKVKGFNNDGEKGQNIAELKIHIITPFVKSIYFYISLFIIFITLFFILLKYRTYRLSKKEKELRELVALQTKQLNAKAEKLERINKIVRIINSYTSFEDQLSQIMEESKILPGLNYMSIYVFDSTINSYYLAKNIYPIDSKISFTEQNYSSFKNCSEKITEHLWLNTAPTELALIGSIYQKTKNILFLEIKIEEQVVGVIIFGFSYSIKEYKDEFLELLEELSLHFSSVFQRGKLVNKLQEINKNKNEIIGIAAHDLRNPLSAIISASEIINFYLDKDKGKKNVETVKKNNETILKSALRMDKLIKDLLNTSEIESGKVILNKEEAEISSIFEQSLNSFQKLADKKNISLSLEKKDLPKILIDKSKIRQVADNLISNAIKYTFPDGKVKVFFDYDENFVYVNVQDTGQGLSEEDLKHIFKSFKRLSAKPTAGESSTGLGLAIVKRIIKMHNGKIWVNSKKNEGSTFTFTIPINLKK